jgi:hypothetical protein
MMINLVGCSNQLLPPCVMLDSAYLEWLIKLELELKLERKDLLFVAFRQKQTSQAKNLVCLGVGYVYTNRRVSLAGY